MRVALYTLHRSKKLAAEYVTAEIPKQTNTNDIDQSICSPFYNYYRGLPI